jgi:16S rRNA processing protein RimM
VELFVDRDVLPDAEDEDDFYYADLIGLSAVLSDGEIYGTVKALHDFGAGDMIELSLDGSGNIILPFTKVVVLKVDIANGLIVIDPPEMFGDPEPAQTDEPAPLNQNGEGDAE